MTHDNDIQFHADKPMFDADTVAVLLVDELNGKPVLVTTPALFMEVGAPIQEGGESISCVVLNREDIALILKAAGGLR